MFAWDTVDGRCLENRKHPGYIHTSIQVMMDNYFESVRNHVKLEIRSFVIQNFDSLVKSNHYSVPILVLFATCNFLCIFNQCLSDQGTREALIYNYFESVRNHVKLEIRLFVIQNFDSLVKSNQYSVPILVLFATCNFLCIFNQCL